jgi:threonyl-tRNA synthetase
MCRNCGSLVVFDDRDDTCECVFCHCVFPSEEAVKLLEDMGEQYKVELAKEHTDKGENISFYKQGDFTDLCAGPHLMSVSAIKAVELTNCTGAYWRGDANKAQLCRVYGVAFPKASMLE